MEKIESIDQLENLLIDDFVILVTDKIITAYFHNEIGID